MKRKDVVVLVVVLGIVFVVAGMRTSRERRAAATGSAAAPATASIPRLVDLGAGRCVACVKMAPILIELRSEYAGRADVLFIDVWERTDLADGYSFRAIPTQIFYGRDGREVWRHEGFLDKPDIVAQFQRMGVE